MAFLNSLDISGSALTAERFRLDTIAQNMSNINVTMTPEGTPYCRKQVVFQERTMDFKTALRDETYKLSNGGVRVKEVVDSKEEFVPVYDPSHPHANEDGYVMHPNVNRAEEYIDAMSASTAYNANISMLSVIQSMAMKALEIGK